MRKGDVGTCRFDASRRRKIAPSPLVTKLRRGFPLTDDDARALLGLCRDTRVVHDGRDVIAERERPDHVHLIVDGWAARYKLLHDGSRQITAFLLPGDIDDLHANLLRQSDHGIVALTPLRVAFVAPDALEQLMTSRPGVARALRWSMLVDKAILRAWLVNVGRRDAKARVMHLFCELRERLVVLGFAKNDPAPFPLTQEEIGDALGLTPVHVNRVLQRMRADGLIVLHRRLLQVRDFDRLAAAAGFSAAYLHAVDAALPAVRHLAGVAIGAGDACRQACR